MTVITASPVALHLRHPLQDVWAVARIVGAWVGKVGEQLGYVLQFPDGHRCSLTFEEIRQLQENTE